MAGDNQPEIKVKIPRELYDRFQRVLPIYGAFAWTMRSAIEAMCDQLESQPTLQEQVVAAIQRATRLS